MIQTLTSRILMIASFGALSVAVSEFWFYEVHDDVGSIGIILAYGLLGYGFLITLSIARVHSRAGLIVAMSLLGFLIEGVPVPVVYSVPPLTIVWTSLAWHMLITLWLGWYIFKRVMTHGALTKAIVLNIAIGIGLGAWNAYMWNAVESADGALVLDWHATQDFAAQFLFGYALFIAGHVVFERCYRTSARFTRVEAALIAIFLSGAAIMTAIASGLWVLFPVLPTLVIFCLWALRQDLRLGATDRPDIIATLNQHPIPPARYFLSVLIPLCAISTYAIFASNDIRLEMNAYLIFTAGPISVWMFISSLWKLARPSNS